MSLGLDIGKYSIKIVELAKDKDQVYVKNIGSKNTFDNLNKFDLEKLSKTQIAACIQDLCNELNIKPKKMKTLISSLSGENIDVRQISTMEMPDNELIVSLELEAKKHVPLDGTDAVVDFYHLGSHKDKLDQINVILATTTKNKISDHAQILKSSGFKPGIFDADPIAITNIYQFNNQNTESGADVIINIGNSTTTLVVYGENSNFFTREINISGDHITKEIMRKFNIDYSTAEEKKYNKGINVFIGATENATKDSAISIEKRTIFNDFVEEIRKTLRFYMKNNSNAFFNKFYLSGGSSMILGIDKFIADHLNVTVESFDPFNKIANDKEINNPAQFSIALGLALRGLEK